MNNVMFKSSIQLFLASIRQYLTIGSASASSKRILILMQEVPIMRILIRMQEVPIMRNRADLDPHHWLIS